MSAQQKSRWTTDDWWWFLWEHAPVAPYVEGGRVNAPDSPFRFFTWERNPRCYPQVDHHDKLQHHVRRGTRRQDLLEEYCQALEKTLAGLQARITRPITLDGFKVPVFVCDVEDIDSQRGSPFVDEVPVPIELINRAHDADAGNPRPWSGLSGNNKMEVLTCIALRSRFRVCTHEQEVKEARAEAAHEVRHWFNAGWLPWRTNVNLTQSPPALLEWLWFDEALCVMTEAELPQLNDRWLIYMLDWVDGVAHSVIDPRFRYQSAMFTRYIARLMRACGRPWFLEEVWSHSDSVWNPVAGLSHSPISALELELSRTPGCRFSTLCSPDASVSDLFASGFCFDTYFIHDKDQDGHEPEVYDRFRDQAITRTWQVDELPTNRVFRLPPLACHYFRICPTETSISLHLRLEKRSATDALKAELVLVSGETQTPVANTRTTFQPSTELTLHATLPGFSSIACEYALVIVSNVPCVEDLKPWAAGIGLPDAAFTLHLE